MTNSDFKELPPGPDVWINNGLGHTLTLKWWHRLTAIFKRDRAR